VNGEGAYEGEMNEVAVFEKALRAAVPTLPDPRIGHELVPRLAAIARTATIEAETRGSRWGTAAAGRRRAGSRRALVARVGIAVGLIPLILAGLAVAGVTVPGPARDAFDAVGVTLPNQPAQHSGSATRESQPQGTGNDVSDAAKSGAHRGPGGNSEAAHRHARQQHSKARGKALGHQRGKAIGLNDLTPPGQSGDTGSPDQSNAGGNGGGSARSDSVHSSPHPPPPHPFPGRGRARGHSK
jgi:hypothetical protein